MTSYSKTRNLMLIRIQVQVRLVPKNFNCEFTFVSKLSCWEGAPPACLIKCTMLPLEKSSTLDMSIRLFFIPIRGKENVFNTPRPSKFKNLVPFYFVQSYTSYACHRVKPPPSLSLFRNAVLSFLENTVHYLI